MFAEIDEMYVIIFLCFVFSYIDECDLMKRSNSCSRGLFRATQGGWSKTITMTSGGFDISDWCFCHVKPYDKSNSYFKVIYNKFEVGICPYQLEN